MKSAFAAVIGRPSTGKSTLVNLFCGGKVSIVSAVPQTTRDSIRGILTTEKGQLIFVDTPGRHISENKFNIALTKTSDRVIKESDILLYMLDAAREPGAEEEEICRVIRRFSEKNNFLQEKTVCAINKIDSSNANLQKTYDFLAENLPELPKNRIFEISALQKQGTDALLDALFSISPEGEAYYPADCYTDQETDFRVSEIIREAAIQRLREELPHAVFVEIENISLKNAAAKNPFYSTLSVCAAICVKRDSQKGIVIGKGGAMLRSIREAALKELAEIFEWKIKLTLRVKCS